MTTTLKQLAAELNLSTATVSLALRNSPLIARRTTERVHKLAVKRNYIRSNIGLALQARRSHLIGYLINGVTRTFYNEVLQGAGDAAMELNYGLIVGWVAEDDIRNERQVRLMLEKDVDALIVSEHRGAIAPFLSHFAQRGKPVVYSTGVAPEPYYSVVNDDFYGGFLAVKHLAEAGHRHILVSDQLEERYAGNVAAGEKFNLHLTVYRDCEDVVEIVSKDRRITGIAAYSDEEAFNIMYDLREVGFRIPEDISVIGFNDLAICARPEFQLTSIGQQRSQLGYQAVRLAVELVEKRSVPEKKIVLAPELVVRNTVSVAKNVVL